MLAWDVNNLKNVMASLGANCVQTKEIKSSTDREYPVNVKDAARFLGVSPSLVYSYVERKQIPHYRMMGRAIRFRISELAEWLHQFHVNGESHE
jgi:excisionase family DNA binding protein